jgi:hypothetical protein
MGNVTDNGTESDIGTGVDAGDRIETGDGSDTVDWVSPVEDSYTAVEKTETGKVPFSADTILTYHVIIDPDLYAEMEQYEDDEAYRPISLRVRGDGVSEEEDYALGRSDFRDRRCGSAPQQDRLGGERNGVQRDSEEVDR